ncbi:MAG: hypothetical protein P1U74_07055 [Legionellaceae bacterium]|nr:hypothetical protein [Legionellaceae bacterium]
MSSNLKNKAPIVISLVASFIHSSYAGTMGDEPIKPHGNAYIGGFGGAGTLSSINTSQEGTSLLSEASGGPLEVEAKGTFKSQSAWLAGGHVGYRFSEQHLNYFPKSLSVSPATELEAYYVGGVKLTSQNLVNQTPRLAEHKFTVTLPQSTTLFLINAVLNFNHMNYSKYRPYLGLGFGGAIVSISNANSVQTVPAEDYNHFSANTNDTASVVAFQPKVGVHIDLNKTTNVFLEYRFVYVSSTSYTFGSTTFSGEHSATTNWRVPVSSQRYNFFTAGIQYDI